MGTFILTPNSIPSQHDSGWVNIIAFQWKLGPGVFSSQSILYSNSGNCFSLDGAPAISFANLPAGFTPTFAALSGNPISVQEAFGPPIPSYFLNWGSFSAGPFTVSGGGGTVAIPNGTSALDLYLNSVGSTWTVGAGGNYVIINGPFSITGTYEIQEVIYTIENPTIPIKTGDKIKIDSTLGDLDSVKEIKISYTDPIDGPQDIIIDINNQSMTGLSWIDLVFVRQPYHLYFYLPPIPNRYQGPIIITIIYNGIQYSGSVTLGMLNVFFEDSSGIYRLVNNQNYDVLYIKPGNTTSLRLLTTPDLFSQDEILYEDDFFSLLPYPRKILSQTDIDTEDDNMDVNSFMFIPVLQAVSDTIEVEIPSPYIKTAFIP